MRSIKLTNKVYLRKCDNYTDAKNEIKGLIQCILKDMEMFDPDGKNVVIKPNLLAKKTPENAVTTAPELVFAAADFFVRKGANVVIADSPGGAYQSALLKGIYSASQMDIAAKESGAVLNYDLGFTEVNFPQGKKSKRFNIINPLAGADLVVNICRMKTHSLCQMSAAVKNMYGSIPGLQKAEQHARFPQRRDFANMLIDLCLCTAPQVNITDAVIGMEGNGPAGGTPKKVGAILGSADPFASDLLCAYLMGYKPEEVETVAEAIKRKLCAKDISKLNICGENPEEYKSEFVRPDSSAGGLIKQLPNVFGGRLREFLEPHPAVVRKKCIGCGKCAECCPQKTIEIANKKAVINKNNCIKCYCCQELCPQKAIDARRNAVMRMIDFVSGSKKK